MTTSTGLEQKADINPVNVPNPSGFPYKTEIRLFENEFYVIKLNCWWDRDPRNDLHNHPWSFESYILNGGYTENIGGTLIERKTGDVNRVMNWQFHSVVAVAPETVSLMVCTKDLESGDWGHIVGGRYIANQPDKDFMHKFRKVNPSRFNEDGDPRFHKPGKVAQNVLRNYKEDVYNILKSYGITLDWLANF